MLSNNPIPLEERKDLSEVERKMWRTLIRVSSLDENKVGFIMTGWNFRKSIYFDRNQLSCDLIKNLKIDYRFHAHFNLGVENPEDVYIDLNTYEKD